MNQDLGNNLQSLKVPQNISSFNSNIVPAVKENIITEEYHEPNFSFQFNEEEIKQAFDVLDRNKVKYITEKELSFFLNILEIQCSHEEIEEMIRMADSKGDNKVRFEDFSLMVKGMIMSPINMAFPPTIATLEQKNVK